MLRILALLLAAPRRRALALAQDAPDALVKRVTDEVLAVIKADKDLQGGNTRKIAELAEDKVLPHFDFTRMTRLAVGPQLGSRRPTRRRKRSRRSSARSWCAPTRPRSRSTATRRSR